MQSLDSRGGMIRIRGDFQGWEICMGKGDPKLGVRTNLSGGSHGDQCPSPFKKTGIFVTFFVKESFQRLYSMVGCYRVVQKFEVFHTLKIDITAFYNDFAYFFLPRDFVAKSLIYILDMAFKPLKQINWMEISGLLVGIFFTVAVMVFGIVLYAKLFSTGMIGVEEYRLHSNFEKAFGLRPGTRVQISGVDVGQIGGMDVEGEGVKIEFIIRKEFQNLITDSATVFAMRDQNMISARIINIDIRRGKGRVLEDGDYLPPGQAQDIETVLETANELLGRVNQLIDAADTILGMAMDTGTTIGALFGSRLLYDNLNRQLNRLDDIIRFDGGYQALAAKGGQPDEQCRHPDGQGGQYLWSRQRALERSWPCDLWTFGLYGSDGADAPECGRLDGWRFEHVDCEAFYA